MPDARFQEPALRVRHFPGERLIAPDLLGDVDTLAWLRRAHMVALHDTWGVALGLRIAGAGAGLAVGPGIAYDARGRELVSDSVRRISAPADAAKVGPYDLAIAYDRRPGSGGAQFLW